ncbi:MAG: response regulator transcription factor [Marinisporobacter sp.]|jgi:DNA-binding response OmpR family regulator|nr:response regulator transcription factor [Marinisporobacter sp.]
MNNILLVEDDQSLNRGISFKLSKEGYHVTVAESINDARDILHKEKMDLILLDVTLPDGSGFDFCQEIRKENDVFIIFLTACDTEIDIVTGLDLGGDDYITKPFSLMVLLSKINALQRRYQLKKGESLVSRDFIFYPENMKLLKNNKEIFLSKTELKLISFFLKHPQKIITKEQLLEGLWDIDGNFIDENTIAVNIRRLREKVEDNPSNPAYIKTIRGVGYVWTERCIWK